MRELEIIDRTVSKDGSYRIIKIGNCDQMGDMLRNWAPDHDGVFAVVHNILQHATRTEVFEIMRDVKLAVAKIREEYELQRMICDTRANDLEDRRYGSRAHSNGCCCHRCVARDPRPDPSLPIYAREIALLDIRVHKLENKLETDSIISRAAHYGRPQRRGMRDRNPDQTL